ncbi:ankyrin repeat domain-containing protein 29-like isoform X1 [Haliotis rubra]|uniref:ankyrin repeat domain-containing protein 29-like isoform X1 n=1 Tax=Haliotis rubra TaxID=36100 RepID=UPI001EE5C78E|nr:ankyrin repeat domain-containing protein 29-like isoform X1 [Haliotis rubra]
MSGLDDRAMISRLKKAVGCRDLQTVQRLVKGGVDVNQRFWYGSTLLLEAVSVGCVSIVQALIKAKAEVQATNEDGRTALHIAARAGFTDIVIHLLKAGARIDARILDGDTSLHLAVWREHEEVVRQLLAAGAKVNIQSKDGWTPLRWAAKLNHMGIAKLLVEHGAAINYKAKTGETPLYETLLQCHFEMARYLIVEGADVNLGSQKSSFPHLIAKCKHFHSHGKKYLDMLTVAGYNIHKDRLLNAGTVVPKLASNLDQEMFQHWLQSSRETVPSLMCLCRTRVRRRIGYCVQGRSIRSSLKETPLPRILVDYLLLQDDINEIEDTCG